MRRCHQDAAVTTFLLYTGDPLPADRTVVLCDAVAIVCPADAGTVACCASPVSSTPHSVMGCEPIQEQPGDVAAHARRHLERPPDRVLDLHEPYEARNGQSFRPEVGGDARQAAGDARS